MSWQLLRDNPSPPHPHRTATLNLLHLPPPRTPSSSSTSHARSPPVFPPPPLCLSLTTLATRKALAPSQQRNGGRHIGRQGGEGLRYPPRFLPHSTRFRRTLLIPPSPRILYSPRIPRSPRMAFPRARLVLHWRATNGRTSMAVVASGAKTTGGGSPWALPALSSALLPHPPRSTRFRPPLPAHFPLRAPHLRLVLHWKATKGRTIKMAVVASGAKAAGWFAVGFSPNGGMSGSNAIATDSSGSPVTKDLVGQSSADDAAWTVGSGSISTSGGKVTMNTLQSVYLPLSLPSFSLDLSSLAHHLLTCAPRSRPAPHTRFTKMKGDGASVKVKAGNDNNIVWAFGDGDTVSVHNGA
ncbi:unnamed protein product [Closterium sp. Naga37s-1]|nr:unnamed protein product [Closterium sp. Naga37s-1]